MRAFSMISVVLVSLLLLPAAGVYAQDQDLIETVGNGTVNWSKGVILAKGIGAPPEKYYGKPQARPMALRAAKLDALRNLLETTKGVQIDSHTMVNDFMVSSDVIAARVDGMVKGAQVVKQEYLSDGTVEITMQMSLNGGFAQLVLPQEIKQIETVRPVMPESQTMEQMSPTSQQPPMEPAAAAPTAGQSMVYTGLVVDARGIEARPAMAPKVLDESGQEVYGSAYVSREFAVQQGMSGYARDLTAAQSNPRVTNNPLTVKGLRTEGTGRSDIVVSNADASRLRSASENLSFLKKCRVMIVVD
jgi:hypothetical protein